MNRLLLAAGMEGPVVFLVTVVLGAGAQPGYSHVTHAVSELTQRGAPNAFWVSIGFAVSAMLCGVFGLGVLQHARPGDAALQRTGWLLLAYALLAILPGSVFPIDPFRTRDDPGLMHIVLVAAAAVVLIALLILGGRALRDRHPWFPGYGASGECRSLQSFAAVHSFIHNQSARERHFQSPSSTGPLLSLNGVNSGRPGAGQGALRLICSCLAAAALLIHRIGGISFCGLHLA